MYLVDDVKGVRVELAGQDLVLPIFIYVIFLPKKWIPVMSIMLNVYAILLRGLIVNIHFPGSASKYNFIDHNMVEGYYFFNIKGKIFTK